MFSVVYSLKRLQLDRDFRLGIPTLFLEFLQWLILIFGPEWDWDIDWSNRCQTDPASHLRLTSISSFETPHVTESDCDVAAGGDFTVAGNCSVQLRSEVISCF